MWIRFTVYIDHADWQDMDLANNIDILWTHYKLLSELDDLGYQRHLSILEDLEQWIVIVQAVYEIPRPLLTWLLLKYPQMFDTRKTYEKVEIFDEKPGENG